MNIFVKNWIFKITPAIICSILARGKIMKGAGIEL